MSEEQQKSKSDSNSSSKSRPTKTEESPEVVIPEELNELLEEGDIEDKAQLLRILGISMQSPVPFAGFVKGYENAVKDGGTWLLQYTKDSQNHRHTLDLKNINSERLGLLAGFIIAMTCIISAVILQMNGHSLVGFGVFLSTVVTLVGLFVYNKHIERVEAKEKREARRQRIEDQAQDSIE